MTDDAAAGSRCQSVRVHLFRDGPHCVKIASAWKPRCRLRHARAGLPAASLDTPWKATETDGGSARTWKHHLLAHEEEMTDGERRRLPPAQQPERASPPPVDHATSCAGCSKGWGAISLSSEPRSIQSLLPLQSTRRRNAPTSQMAPQPFEQPDRKSTRLNSSH